MLLIDDVFKTLFFSVMVMSGDLTFMIVPTALPPLLNIILDLKNNTIKKALAYKVEYFVDEDEYFNYIFMHILMGAILIGFIIGSIDIMYIVLIHHVTGSFDAIR